MNPYVYSRNHKGHKAHATPQEPLALASSLFDSIINAKVSTAIALATIIFAAGSVMAMTSLATPEIALAGSDSPIVHQIALRQTPSVLGAFISADPASIIDDSALEATTTIPSVKLSAKPKSFDSTLGRWDYTISYASKNLGGTGSITIGTYVVASSTTGSSGSVETGSILKPGTVYHVIFWVTDSGGNQLSAAQIQIKTPKGSSSNKDLPQINPCQAPAQASSTAPSGLSASSTMGSMFCLKNKQGQVVCPRPPVCGQMEPDGLGRNSSGTPPNWPPKPPMGGMSSSSPGRMPPFPPAPQGGQQPDNGGPNNQNGQ